MPSALFSRNERALVLAIAIIALIARIETTRGAKLKRRRKLDASDVRQRSTRRLPGLKWPKKLDGFKKKKMKSAEPVVPREGGGARKPRKLTVWLLAKV